MARTAHSPSSSGGTSHNSRPLCRNVDESIAELRQIADGGNDILAGRRDHRRLLSCQPSNPLNPATDLTSRRALTGQRLSREWRGTE